MSGLAIIVADDNAERFRTVLVMAASQAAIGGEVRLFLQGKAVAMIRDPLIDPDGEAQSAVGLPTLGELFEECLALGVVIGACQSSLALLSLSASDFHPNIEWGGMTGLLAAIEPDHRLLVI